MTTHKFRATLLAAALATALSGCSWTGLNSVSLPFTKGRGADDVQIQVELPNAANLVPNSEVKFDDVTVGSVRKIELRDWKATLTVGIEKDSPIPADVTAMVAQKSLLGAEYLDLRRPTGAIDAAATPVDTLKTGDVIGLERSGRYPETEEVLAAASMLLNGGGLAQIRTITHELNQALEGRTGDVKSFLRSVRSFTGRLDGQRDNIATALTQLNRLSRAVTSDQSKVRSALQTLPQGFALLETQRADLVRTLKALDRFGEVADRVVGDTKADLQRNLDNIRPITKALADTGTKLAQSVDMLGYPFSVRQMNKAVVGDYVNLRVTVNVSAGQLTRDWLGGTPLDGLFTAFIDGAPTGPASEASDPLSSGPLDSLLGSDGPLSSLDLLGGGDNRGSAPNPAAPNESEPPVTQPLGGLLNQLLGGHQ